MKKAMLLLAATALLALSGCKSNCSKLQDQCDACNNPTTKSWCNVVVTADVSDACKAALDAKSYESDSAACK